MRLAAHSPRAVAAIAAGMAGAALAACGPPPPDPGMVAEWSKSFYGAIRVERLSPPVASRLMVYFSAALYGGLAAADPSLPALEANDLNGLVGLPSGDGRGRLDGTLVAVAAERVVIDSLLLDALPTTRAALGRLADSLEAARATSVTAPGVRTASAAMGREIGLAVVAWSHSDGFDSTRGRPYVPPVGPGLWANDAPASTYASQTLSGASEFIATGNPANVLTPGAASDRSLILSRPKGLSSTLPAVNMSGMSEPFWGQIRPFALASWSECPIPDPPPYSTDAASALHRNASEVVSAKAKLTEEQRTIALYWADNAGESGTPVGHWISIASQVAGEQRLAAGPAARLMLLTAVAQADAFITSWGFKYRYNLLRPRTFIRRLIDRRWEPLIPTPPFPEYPSAHSTQSAAAAGVLTAVLGERAFDDSTSVSIGHAVRRFASFRAAAAEAGMSRIYGGIHYPIGNVAGRQLGECIGDKVIARMGAR